MIIGMMRIEGLLPYKIVAFFSFVDRRLALDRSKRTVPEQPEALR